MAVKSSLEWLPNELLDLTLGWVIDHDLSTLQDSSTIDFQSVAQLLQCSRFLSTRLEPLLYSTRQARNHAMRHGCETGNEFVIRKATRWGAYPGTIDIPTPKADYQPVFSLQVALDARQLDAFRLLLQLGAGVRLSLGDSSESAKREFLFRRDFAENLSKLENDDYLTAFMKARGGSAEFRALVSQLKLSEIVRWATLDLLTELLGLLDNNDEAVNTPTWSHQPKKYQAITPLGAACLRGNIDIFRLLVARGADVHAEDSTARRPYDIRWRNGSFKEPCILAARFMAKTGDPVMLQACVDAGADINRPYYYCPPLSNVTTPLLTFLSSISSWEISSHAPGDGYAHMRPSECTAYFIHTLGGRATSPTMDGNGGRQTENRDRELYRRFFKGPVELLLGRWGLGSLAIPEFFEVVKLLVAHGGTEPDLARVLVPTDKISRRQVWKPEYVGLWQDFLALLTPQLASLDQEQKDALLRRVIVNMSTFLTRMAHRSRWIEIEGLGRASIDAIINAGADINHVAESKDAVWDQRVTPLHQMLSALIHTNYLTERFLHDHEAGCTCPYVEDVSRAYGGFLAFLVSRGADPLIEDVSERCESEKTAIDTLMSPMRTRRIKFVGGTAEQTLRHFVARLMGE
ncbi:hypothetical protein F4778DRAFT_109051 [Xylariomycetidae sp. FL2044]|nr:hypothetical protein F4778DRAFT_109051 [Xylariomycetidae sp. FL2044]